MAVLASAGRDDRAAGPTCRASWKAAPTIRSAPAPSISARSLYRIHGTNEPHTIGQAVSSGCIRMLNEDVVDLYNRVKVGTSVIVI